MTRRLALPRVLAVSATVLLVFAGSARADTFCVNHTGCADAGHNFMLVQAAVDAADANDPSTGTPTRDTIRIGSGVYEGAVDDGIDNPVDIYGSGRYFPGLPPELRGTLLERFNGNSVRTVQMGFSFGSVAASSLHDMSVKVPTGKDNTGVHTAGNVVNVHVISDGALTRGVGIEIAGNGPTVFRNGSVDLLDDGSAVGVRTHLANVKGSYVRASTGVEGDGVVSRSTIDAHVGATGGGLRIEDCVMHLFSPGATAFEVTGIGLNAFERITARHVTAIGDGGSGSLAVSSIAKASTSSNSATVDVRSSILRGFATNFKRSGDTNGAHDGTADIVVAYSDYDMTLPKDDAGGPGAINDTNPGHNTSADPGFVSLTDRHLMPTSPLIDAGDPKSPDQTVFPPPESVFDFDGLPRKVDGDGNGKARADIGAFEFQQKRPTITSAAATPTNPLTGELVSFTAAGSDPDGEPVTFRWAFGDRTSAAGPNVSHRYANGGEKTAKVTVTDSRGLKRTREIVLHVRGPAIRIKTPRTGATYKLGQKVIADYSCSEPFGPAKVVSCKGPVGDGKPIHTGTAGKHTFTVKATDKAGNKATKSVRYSVKT